MNGVKYVINSGNKKISGSEPIDATYVSTNSCPNTCPLKRTCYAKLGPLGFVHVNRLNNESYGMTARELAMEEAKAIDSSYNGGPIPNNRCLRLHVSGDTRTVSAAKIINLSVKRWKSRGNGSNLVWSYTHAWDKVFRDEWNEVSMLASVDNLSQVEYARQNGYAPSLVVAEHVDNKVYKLAGSSVRWIPCMAQVKGISCERCRLCMKADYLFSNNMGITFEAHGARKNELKKSLKDF
jgi:hypothetical protein